ncbi:NADPH-dependent FMN reductase [Metabacillus rhizolycopersici]|uniref:NAD(P)H-dependent oxidoreductase n=1 Tax=Metabacillus rhizolycopersici TaxID=2875709 RepID=A0ABS7UWP3_9BACI|nr:NADPH-dependent FMN reductase [Metabacillus rhizolycopersici]MBZ5752738.1 NAD(P)H-dependent oxidoreductase [Metabacillus rhizolycopersici]
MTIKVKAIIGSTSSTSFNLKIVEFMKNRYANQLDITPVLINDVEMYSIDIENDVPANTKKFKQDVKDSDAVLFAVPEYNFSIPGAMKNAIDWLSRGGDFEIKDKPAFIVGSSMGALGSVRAQIHLREILSNPNLSPILLPNNEVYIGSIHEKVDEAGEITDQATIEFLDSVVKNFVEFYNKTNSLAAVHS